MSDQPDNGNSFPFFFSMPTADQIAERINQQRRRVDQQDHGRAAINVTLMDEYYGLVDRCKAYDELLAEHPDGPGITQEIAAAAWVRHDLASQLAKRLYDSISNPDQCSEFLAQLYEHKAAAERWNLRLAHAIGIIQAAVPTAEGGIAIQPVEITFTRGTDESGHQPSTDPSG